MKREMIGGRWVKPHMTVTEWMTSVNTGYRRECLNTMRKAKDHSVWDRLKDPKVSITTTIRSCLAELSGCKVHDVYPDLQNAVKLPWDLIIPHTRWDEKLGQSFTRNVKVDIKTPNKEDDDWVCVAEKYERKKCEIYLFVYSKTPDISFGKTPAYLGDDHKGRPVYIPHVNVSKTVMRYNDHTHGCKCLGWARGDFIFRPENLHRKEDSEKGFFILRSELKKTMEDCLD